MAQMQASLPTATEPGNTAPKDSSKAPQFRLVDGNPGQFTEMDMVFSSPVHQDAHLTVHIIDDAWAAETLPVEDIEVPPAAMATVDEDDNAIQHDDDDEDKWNDLALEELVATLPPPSVEQGEPRVASSTQPQQQEQEQGQAA